MSSGKAALAKTCAVPERLTSGPHVGFEKSRDAVKMPSRLIKPSPSKAMASLKSRPEIPGPMSKLTPAAADVGSRSSVRR